MHSAMFKHRRITERINSNTQLTSSFTPVIHSVIQTGYHTSVVVACCLRRMWLCALVCDKLSIEAAGWCSLVCGQEENSQHCSIVHIQIAVVYLDKCNKQVSDLQKNSV